MSDCRSGELYALRVLGDDMAPEFRHGEIIVVEPDGQARDGSFVLAELASGASLRQLCRSGDGWALRTLAPPPGAAALQPLPDLQCVRGVVIQKAVPGRRRLTKRYV